MYAALFLYASFSWAKVSLNSGDLLFQPLDCSLCTLIEEEENGPFSHIGMVVKLVNGEVMVLEAFESVRLVSLADFLKKTQKNSPVVIGRFENKLVVDGHIYKEASRLLGAPYDSKFSWKDDAYYCSELVSKILFPILEMEIPIKRMHFIKNREKWLKHFKGNPPDGELGNSPMDLFTHPDLSIIASWTEGVWSLN
jgi:hypothetical protein